MAPKKVVKPALVATPTKAPTKSSRKKAVLVSQVADKQKEVKKKKTAKKPPVAPPKTPGRKRWVPDYGKIENWATQGLLDKEIAALCGVCEEVFNRRKNQLNQPELKTALEVGKAKGIAAVSQVLLGKALKGDNDMVKFYMERIGGRKNITVLETPTKPVHEMSEEELLAIINGTQIK